MTVEVLLAESLGFCFGVRDALALVRDRARRAGKVHVLGPIVHNPEVVRELEHEGVAFVRSLDEVPAGAELVLTPHGVADPVHAAARTRVGTERLADATCPLVRRVHDAAKRLLAERRHVVLVGRKDHVEVRGLVESFAMGDVSVVLEDWDVDALEPRERLGVVAQTTQPLPRVKELVGRLRARFPAADVRFVDTVCHPTKTRQEAVKRLAREVELVVIVGGRSSNNVRELVDSASAEGARTLWVEGPGDLEPGAFHGVRRVGVTAGTSTPDASVAAVVHALERLP